MRGETLLAKYALPLEYAAVLAAAALTLMSFVAEDLWSTLLCAAAAAGALTAANALEKIRRLG